MKLFWATLLLVVIGLSLNGCVTNVVTVGGGNTFTFSNNGNGVLTGQKMETCAYAVQELLTIDPSIDGDAEFINCQKAVGVIAI